MRVPQVFKRGVLTRISHLPILLYLLKNLRGSRRRFRLRRLIRNPQFIAGLQNGTVELRLDVCGGKCPYKHGYLNIDIQKLPEVDIIADIRKKMPFPDNCVTEIFSCGTLEHFSLDEVRRSLNEFYRMLKPQGRLIIGVPSLKKICHAYTSGEIGFKTINQYLYGAQRTGYDFHKNIFDFDNMKLYLSEAGFCEIEEVTYDLPFHIPKYMMKTVCKKV